MIQHQVNNSSIRLFGNKSIVYARPQKENEPFDFRRIMLF